MHSGGNVPPPLDVHQLLTRWSFIPIPDVALIAVAGLYFMGVVTLRERGDRWSWGRTSAFFGGLLVGAYAITGGLAAYDDVLFSAHMAQHMLLTMVAPPLLALGAPITLALRALPVRPRGWLNAVLQSGFGRVIANPGIGFALMAVSPFALYFSGLYPYTLEHPWAHDLAHLHFLTVGCIFFWPLLGIDPLPHRPPHWGRVLLLFLMLPFHAFLGLALMSGNTAIAAAEYTALGRTWGASPLSDQHTGGGIIWGTGDLLGAFLFLIVLVQWSRADDREARRTDRALDRDDNALEAYNARLAALAAEEA